MRTMDILLVDDDSYLLDLLSILLKCEGFEVVAASDGIEALKVLQQVNFRLMITDFSMPQLDGLELATNVKEQHPGTPVVLITGNAMSDFIESAVSVGISKVFPKPLDLQIFLPFIRSLLQEGLSYVHGDRPLDQGFQRPVG